MAIQTLQQRKLFKSKLFDHYFVWGIALIGITSALLVQHGYISFYQVFILDIYLLGYHHVISTFTRFSYDKKSLIENRNLLLYAPIFVFLCVAILFFRFGAVAIATIYLHWQWYHYTRQSEGLAKAFGIKTGNKIYTPRSMERALFYLTPITTFATMSARTPETFLFMDVFTITLPMPLLQALWFLNLSLFAYWLITQSIALSKKETSLTYFLYFLSHHAIYYTAYILIKDITVGWLAINIWHNLQYISFVWYCNINEHKKGTNKNRPIISWLSQEKYYPLYFVFCAGLSYLLYSALDLAIRYQLSESQIVVAAVVVYTSINFHHYIVDSVIWKLRKPKLKRIVNT